MLRIVTCLLRAGSAAAAGSNLPKLLCKGNAAQLRCLSVLPARFSLPCDGRNTRSPTLFSQPFTGFRLVPAVLQPAQPQVRTVTKFSRQKGKRKSVKAVIKRFYRLNWGGWIRTKAGRSKRLWKKSGAQRRRLREHVLVNGTQAWLLDKMVTAYWRRPKYYVDDPYEPYHKREEFALTRRKPVLY